MIYGCVIVCDIFCFAVISYDFFVSYFCGIFNYSPIASATLTVKIWRKTLEKTLTCNNNKSYHNFPNEIDWNEMRTFIAAWNKSAKVALLKIERKQENGK